MRESWLHPSVFHRAGIAAALLFAIPSAVRSQEPPSFVVGAGVGATYYCILSRCDTGTTLAGLLAYEFPGPLAVEGTIRLQRCFDCDAFRMAEGSLRLEFPDLFLIPTVLAGFGAFSDPEFLQETKVGPHLAIGLAIPPVIGMEMRLEARGRQIGFGTGDYMGEVSLLLLHRL